MPIILGYFLRCQEMLQFCQTNETMPPDWQERHKHWLFRHEINHLSLKNQQLAQERKMHIQTSVLLY